LMFVYLFVSTTAWVLGEHHIWISREEWNLFYMFAGKTLISAGLLWAFYIAVEPWARKRSPQSLITWTRLLSGDFRDPLVGRDILIGCAAATILLFLGGFTVTAQSWIRSVPVRLDDGNLNLVLNAGTFMSFLLGNVAQAVLILCLGVLVLA